MIINWLDSRNGNATSYGILEKLKTHSAIRFSVGARNVLFKPFCNESGYTGNGTLLLDTM